MHFDMKETIFEIGEPAQKILEISKNSKFDLTIMSIHQRKGFEKLFMEHFRESVNQLRNSHSDSPLPVMNPLQPRKLKRNRF